MFLMKVSLNNGGKMCTTNIFVVWKNFIQAHLVHLLSWFIFAKEFLRLEYKFRSAAAFNFKWMMNRYKISFLQFFESILSSIFCLHRDLRTTIIPVFSKTSSF
jgi:hypothetical protein